MPFLAYGGLSTRMLHIHKIKNSNWGKRDWRRPGAMTLSFHPRMLEAEAGGPEFEATLVSGKCQKATCAYDPEIGKAETRELL